MSATRIDKEELREFVKWVVIDLRSTPNIERQDFNPTALEDFVSNRTKELEALITKRQHQLLDELIESLPEKLDLPSYDNAYAEYKLTKGFNGAVEKITEVLEKKRATLQGGE